MTLRILALDTTSEYGSVALLTGADVIEEVQVHSPSGFGHVLFGHLQTILDAHSWVLSDINCFAAASGPGSFTGLRVGLAAIKGLAAALGKPAVAVSNLAAIASYGTAPMRAALLNARRGEIYGAVYSAALELISPEVAAKFPEWLNSLPAEELEFLGFDIAGIRQSLTGTRFEGAPVREVPQSLAGAVGQIAMARLMRGQAQDPAAIDANYVRRSDAELYWKDVL